MSTSMSTERLYSSHGKSQLGREFRGTASAVACGRKLNEIGCQDGTSSSKNVGIEKRSCLVQLTPTEDPQRNGDGRGVKVYIS
jgi:hypothetical protein